MAERFKINQNSLSPVYQVTLLNGDGRVPDLTSATVVFHLRQINTDVDKVTGIGTIVGDPTLGTVAYQWAGTDTDTTGLFIAFWTVTFPDLTVTDYPDDVADLIEITSASPNLGYTLGEACSPWTTVEAVRLACHAVSSLSGAPNYATDELIATEINVATDLLYVLSGRQFAGECLHVARPCRKNNCFGAPFGYIGTYTSGLYGTVVDESAYPPPSCGCSRISSIDLGYWPVANIVQVVVDGVIVDPTTYRLDQSRYLVRLADNGGWPSCQHLDRPSTEDGTFEVTFEVGMAPPPGGVNAANHLACELVKQSLGQPCQLPGRVTSVNRQQLSFTMINASMLNDGLTGLYDVDLFIIAYNPHKQRGSALVWSPDLDNQSYRAGS